MKEGFNAPATDEQLAQKFLEAAQTQQLKFRDVLRTSKGRLVIGLDYIRDNDNQDKAFDFRRIDGLHVFGHFFRQRFDAAFKALPDNTMIVLQVYYDAQAQTSVRTYVEK